jgi:hypothetical protein
MVLAPLLQHGILLAYRVFTDGKTIGKQWHEPKKAFRPASGLTPYEKRAKDRVAMAMVKAKEKEMKDEKEAERKVRLASVGRLCGPTF